MTLNKIDKKMIDGLEEELSAVTTQLAHVEIIVDFERNAKSKLTLAKLPSTPTPIMHSNESSYEAVHPSVKYFENGKFGYKYWILYTPYPQTNDDYENPFLMASNDGVVWVTPTGISNPIDTPTPTQLSNGYHMSDTEILVNSEGNLELIYRLNVDNNTFEQILRKTYNGTILSGREVIYDGANATMVLSPSLQIIDGQYVMWYVEGRNDTRQIKRMVSPTGILGTWSTANVCALNWRIGEISERPWHLSVFENNGKHYLILNTDTSMALASSTDKGLTFNDCHFILRPSKKPNAFDNKRIYRGCVVKIGEVYRMYYSAFSQQNMWAIGFVEGTTLDTMRGVESVDKDGKSFIPEMKTNKLTLSETQSYLTNKELQFFESGVAAVKIRNTSPNTLTVLTSDGTTATLVLATLIADTVANLRSISPISGRNNVAVNAQLTILPVNNQTPVINFLKEGVAGARIGLGSASNIMKVIRDSDVGSGLLEVSGLLIQNDTVVPSIEGAIRYNISTKKHEGYNGTTWNPMY